MQKIISLLISLTFLLSADINITDLLQSELNTPNFSWNTSGVLKSCRVYKTDNISETVEDRAKVTINGL